MTDNQYANLSQVEHLPEVVTPSAQGEYPLLHVPRTGPSHLLDSLLIRTFRRRGRLLLIIFAVLLACGLTPVLIFVHPIYQAEARLRFVPRAGLNSVPSERDALAGYSGYLASELLRIPESDIVKVAAGKLGTSLPFTSEELLANTSAVFYPGTQVVSVIVCGTSPDGLVEAANAVAEAYIEHDIVPQIRLYQERTQPVRAELTSLEEQKGTLLEILAGRNTEDYIRSLYRRRESYIQPLSQAGIELSAEEDKYIQVSARLAAVTTVRTDSEQVRALLTELVRNDPLMDMYRSIYQAMIATSEPDKLFSEIDESIGSSVSGPAGGRSSSSLKNIKKRDSGRTDDSDRAERASIIEQIRQGMGQRLEELRAEALEEAKKARESEIAAQEAVVQQRERVLTAKGERLEELTTQDRTTAEEITEVRRLDGEVKELDNRITGHAEKLKRLAVELLPPAEPMIHQRAESAKKLSDHRWLFIPASVVLAWLLALFSAMLVEHFDSRLTHAGDIVRRVGIPVLASLPGQDDNQPEEIWLPEEISMADYVNDQYRNIRTAVLFGQGKVPRVIVVTAPTAAETKTTLSVNLAISIARSGRRALLVDADLDNPALADVFDIPSSPGWSDLLRDPACLSQTLCGTRVERLSVMPAGSHLEHSAELLSSPSCRSLLEDLGQRFEHVIIDAPPLLDCPEGRIIGALADGVICSFSARSTRSGQARQATAILEELGASVIGSVLNT